MELYEVGTSVDQRFVPVVIADGLPLESALELWGPNDYWDSVYMVRTIV